MSDVSMPLPEEVAELLSALVDGEVTDTERAEAAGWLERSAAARTEYDELARVKALLRDLPAVDAAQGFYGGLLQRGQPGRSRRRRSRAWGDRSWAGSPAALVASLVATAAAWLLLGGSGRADQLVPPIEDVQVSALAGGSNPVTLLRQEGSVDWDDLPGGVRSDVGDTEVWVASGDGPATVVAERDGAVYTLVSDQVTAVALVAMVDELPEGGPDSTLDNLVDQARDACHTLVTVFDWG